jgi:hypothetical protein
VDEETVDGPERIGGPADEVVEIAAAYDGRGRDEAAAGSAAWTANFKQDFAWRQAMILEMQQGGQAYSEEETALIAKGLALFDGLAAAKGKVRQLKHSKTVTSAWTKRDKKTGMLIGHVEATIRASPEQVIAYQMHYDSKIQLSQLDPALNVRYEVLERKSLHHIVIRRAAKEHPV